MSDPVNCSASELCTYLQALAEGYSPTFYSDTSPCAQSKSMSIASKSYQHGKKTARFHGFPYLPMSADSTGSHGAASSISSLEDSRARTSALPDEEQESRGSDPDSGPSSFASFARYDRATHSWRIPQCSLLGDSDEFSQTWPRWGWMRDGVCYLLPRSEHRTCEKGSGLLPTIRSSDADRGGRGDLIQAVRGNHNKHYAFPTPTANAYGSCQGGSAGRNGQPNRPSLQTMATRGLWPTPTVNGNYNRKGASATSGDGLATAVKYPTPRAHSNSGGGTGLDGGAWSRSKLVLIHGEKAAKEMTSGALNPEWVELLMGWPANWTKLETQNCTVHADAWRGDWELGVPRVANKVESRVDRLKAIGNGQVPQCAAEAWRILTNA